MRNAESPLHLLGTAGRTHCLVSVVSEARMASIGTAERSPSPLRDTIDTIRQHTMPHRITRATCAGRSACAAWMRIRMTQWVNERMRARMFEDVRGGSNVFGLLCTCTLRVCERGFTWFYQRFILYFISYPILKGSMHALPLQCTL